MLAECVRAALEGGAEHMSVVRVLRKLGEARADDRRAISFYRATLPSHRFRVFRLA